MFDYLPPLLQRPMAHETFYNTHYIKIGSIRTVGNSYLLTSEPVGPFCSFVRPSTALLSPLGADTVRRYQASRPATPSARNITRFSPVAPTFRAFSYGLRLPATATFVSGQSSTRPSALLSSTPVRRIARAMIAVSGRTTNSSSGHGRSPQRFPRPPSFFGRRQ